MLHIKRILCAVLLLLLLVQPVFAETVAPTEPQPDIVTALHPVEAIPRDVSPAGAPSWLQALISAPLYTFSGNKWTPLLADALPEDVTGEYAGTYGIAEGMTRGYAFRIRLRADACREDGSAITAGDWANALMLALQQKETADTWLILANAQAIAAGKTKPGSEIVSLEAAGFSHVSEAWAAGYSDFYVDVDGFWGLGGGWRPISDRTRLQDFAMPVGLDEAFVSPAYLYRNYLMDGAEHSRYQCEFLGIPAKAGAAYTTDDLGLIQENDHSLVLLTEQPATASVLMTKLESLILPGTASYGPYHVTASGEELLLEPNPNWFGDTDARGYDRILCQKIGS